jgi:hypothetical protein
LGKRTALDTLGEELKFEMRDSCFLNKRRLYDTQDAMNFLDTKRALSERFLEQQQ